MKWVLKKYSLNRSVRWTRGGGAQAEPSSAPQKTSGCFNIYSHINRGSYDTGLFFSQIVHMVLQKEPPPPLPGLKSPGGYVAMSLQISKSHNPLLHYLRTFKTKLLLGWSAGTIPV